MKGAAWWRDLKAGLEGNRGSMQDCALSCKVGRAERSVGGRTTCWAWRLQMRTGVPTCIRSSRSTLWIISEVQVYNASVVNICLIDVTQGYSINVRMRATTDRQAHLPLTCSHSPHHRSLLLLTHISSRPPLDHAGTSLPNNRCTAFVKARPAPCLASHRLMGAIALTTGRQMVCVDAVAAQTSPRR